MTAKSNAPKVEHRRGQNCAPGERVPSRPHDSGSQANETLDGLDATTELLRHAAEDTRRGADPDDIQQTPVFDRAGLAQTI
jgi:hypothetical protein